jgi:signal transduction histidine kinase
VISLESSKLLNGLPIEQWSDLREAVQVKSLPAGETIFQEGDAGDGVYVVRSGLVEISACMNQEVRRPLTRIPPGDFFGEMAVLDNEPRSAMASAKTDTEVYFIPREALLQALRKSPELALGLLRIFSKRMREFNRQYLDEALQAERLTLVGKFARSIVHDLKNPLNVISLAAEIIGTPGVAEQSRTYARTRILKFVGRIQNMVNELLEFTRGARSGVNLTEANYAEFINQVIEDLRFDLQGDAVEFCFDSPPPPIRLMLDTTRLTHVFNNLVHNAVEIMPKGGKIILRFEVESECLLTEVEDTGPGIPPELEGRLFEPFATHGKAKGTGLGLSICQRIVQDHEGQIGIRREPGRGAIFCIRLPLKRS